ncbi:MAG: ribosome small subunit-dependent GTPase A [Roseicyclus sp.]|jgi:ribosome biogenesis GTPase|nr:ribosome small subunit-dependent GTPase A [Roseicyclus sp.]
MTRDYSAFLPGTAPPPRPGPDPLTALGWGPAFARQIDAEALAATPPVRVMSVHRSGMQVQGDAIATTLPPLPEVTVGDWLLLDRDSPHQSRLLDRTSLIQRRAPGHDRRMQPIAANLDTVFVVTSCNADFNVARLERYLALAFEAGIEPVILLTKADLAEDPAAYTDQASAISARVPALALDARGGDPARALADWCRPGRTVGFLGSSGVGKSTLTNALLGSAALATQTIREDDAKGRHTTTHRELHAIPGGCLVLDTPGMRELQLADAADGIADLFDDITALAADCRFSDCAHDREPGCAVRAAVATGQLDAERVARWHKLLAEDAFNSASLAQRRGKDRAFGKLVRSAVKEKKARGKG